MAKCLKFIKLEWQFPGVLSLLFISSILSFILGGFLSNIPPLAFINTLSEGLSPYLKKVITFSFYQATLSSLLSIIPAYFIAKALYRRDFKYKSLIISLCSTTLIMPSIVVVLGLIFLYGNSGIVTSFISAITQDKIHFSIYGLHGILLAHVFFNLPYATLLFLKALNSISTHQLKLAAQLNFSSWLQFTLIEWPVIKKQIAYLSVIIFTLCFSSFSIVLLLGGGPKATTIELAIYQAMTYEYDFQKAGLLALIQILLCLILLLLSQNLSTHYAAATDSIHWKIKSRNIWIKLSDILLIAILICLVLPPIIAIFWVGFNSDFWATIFSRPLQNAFLNSLIIGLSSAFLALSLGIAISWTARQFVIKQKNRLAQFMISTSSVTLMIPGIVLASGLYISLFHFSLTESLLASPYILIPIINALMALPFVLNQIYPSMVNNAHAYNKLARLYNINAFNRLWLLDIRGNLSVFKKAFAFAMTLSLGDIGVISILGSQNSGDVFYTLPYLLFLKLGNYQTESADVIALILLLLVLGIFMLSHLNLNIKNVKMANFKTN
ncbi:thiamine/thiamine pyrophosphate ABC transporter permease [Thorsellia kenyensis]|uniref:Thiamine transport system permease protein ThiP n=1 Tax=Thorsellia kenyensis TaxID=1549888 RepID=A0ABV6CB79_9GAMM